MALDFEVIYQQKVVEEDIPQLTSAWRVKIQAAIEEKLSSYPDLYGKPLRRSLKGYRKLRIGDYRVVFRIAGTKVLILAILHRSVVYKEMGKR
ncbi:MAG: type II toxin-antitoxin system RelE/ParE family toxin [Minisyncoccia bacterium]|jgi:mRNA interferase RelE/StbE